MPHGNAVGLCGAARGVWFWKSRECSVFTLPPSLLQNRHTGSPPVRTLDGGGGVKRDTHGTLTKPCYLRCAAQTNRVYVRHSAAAPWDDEFRSAWPRLVEPFQIRQVPAQIVFSFLIWKVGPEPPRNSAPQGAAAEFPA